MSTKLRTRFRVPNKTQERGRQVRYTRQIDRGEEFKAVLTFFISLVASAHPVQWLHDLVANMFPTLAPWELGGIASLMTLGIGSWILVTLDRRVNLLKSGWVLWFSPLLILIAFMAIGFWLFGAFGIFYNLIWYVIVSIPI